MIKNGDNVVLKFSTIWDGELCRDNGKAYIYPSMERAEQFYHPGCEVLVEYAPVKHGHWEYWAGHLARCSVCGYEYTDLLECDNYCSNCGAQMDGGKYE